MMSYNFSIWSANVIELFQYKIIYTNLYSKKILNTSPNCDIRNRAYKNGKTFEECKLEARRISTSLFEEISENKEVSWTYILDKVEHDEIVYKLTLKYLRENGYDIGNYKNPRVLKTNHSL